MAEEEVGERTETATSRKRQEARRRGQVVVSRDLTSAVTLLAAIVALDWTGYRIRDYFGEALRHCLAEPWMKLSIGQVVNEMLLLIGYGLLAMAPFFGIVLAAALAILMYQTGGIQVASEKNYFDVAKFNPLNGLQRIFSRRGLARTAVDVAKFLVIGWMAYGYLAGQMNRLASLTMLKFPALAILASTAVLGLAYRLTAVLIVLGIADYVFQLFQYERDMRMTKQEVKEELKDLEGDPRIKARRRQIGLRLARRRMLQRVPEAQVVITNPRELAVALKYEVGEDDAPIVVAKGAGLLAKRIRELAAEHQIPIIENQPLARLLFAKTEPERVIPEETFVAVAEILAYIYQLTNRKLPPRELRPRRQVPPPPSLARR